MKTKFLLISLIIKLSYVITAQNQSFTLKVINKDSSSVGYANVVVENKRLFTTGENGLVNITTSSEEYQKILVSHVSFLSLDTLIKLHSGINLLVLDNIEIEGVEIMAMRNKIMINSSGAVSISKDFMESLPSPLGSGNFTQALKTLPGVQTSYDFSSNFVVRGGETDQNMVLIDNTPLYNVNHVGGVFPVINNEIINSVNFYYGPIPAYLGNRLSSFSLIETRLPSQVKTSAKLRLGLLDNDITIDLPINDKFSLFTSNRFAHFLPLTSISSLLYNLKVSNTKVNIGFYDTYNKLVFKLNQKVNFNFLFYNNKDYFSGSSRLSTASGSSESISGLNWGNIAFSLTNTNLINSKTIIRNIFSYSEYNRNGEVSEKAENYFVKNKISGNIKDISLQSNLDLLNGNNQLKFGLYFAHRRINPATFSSSDTSAMPINFITQEAVNTGLVSSFHIPLSVKSTMDIGVRLNSDIGRNYLYLNAEPRISIKLELGEKMELVSSYSRTRQSVFQIGGNLLGLFDEYWFQIDSAIKPQSSNIFTLGLKKYSYNFESNSTFFYKNQFNLIDAQIAILSNDFQNHEEIINRIIIGLDGYSYGFEQWFSYRYKKLFTTCSYTYSRAKRKHPEIFDGNQFNSTFDRPHNFNVTSEYNVGKNLKLNANFMYQSGLRYSKPDGYIVSLYSDAIPIYSQRNNKSLEPYHRMDLGVTKNWIGKKNKRQKSFTFNIINIYNRKNLSYLTTAVNNGNVKLNKITLIPILASFSYSVIL